MQEDGLKKNYVFCAWGLNTLDLFIWNTRVDFLCMEALDCIFYCYFALLLFTRLPLSEAAGFDLTWILRRAQMISHCWWLRVVFFAGASPQTGCIREKTK